MSDLRRQKQQERNGTKAKTKKKFKPEYIAYIVLAVMVVAVMVTLVVILGSGASSAGGSTPTVVPDCCD